MEQAYCDICGHPMTMAGELGKHVTFKCIACDQEWSIYPGGYNCTILKALWPSGMREDSKMFREEYLPSWLEKERHRAAMMSIAGFLNEIEKIEFLQKIQETYENWFAAHPLSRRPWWQFW